VTQLTTTSDNDNITRIEHSVDTGRT